MRTHLPRLALSSTSLIPSDCFDESDNVDQKFNVSTVYAQVLQNADFGNYLNLTVVGTSPQDILGVTNDSTSLSTLFTTTSWSLCFASTIPWGRNRELTTLITRLRAVDPFGKELVCLDVLTTPLAPRHKSPYGKPTSYFAYWLVVGLARIVSAWGRGITRPGRGIWSRAQSAGFILASAISGERLANSPALMRFCTPSMRDVIFHTQWCAVLAMVAVEWPQFVYPLLTQTAWSTLSYNISLTHSSELNHWNSLNSTSFSPPADFADQFADPTSPLFINASAPNVLFSLPSDAAPGIASFAYTLGLRPQDLFPTCLIIFLGIVAGAIVISVAIWGIDYSMTLLGDATHSQGHSTRLGRTRSPGFGSRDLGDTAASPAMDENKSLTGSNLGTPNAGKFPGTRFALPLTGSGVASERGINFHRSWWRFRPDVGTFHGNVLHGNLIRILVLFHLPITVFSAYQMTLPRSVVGTSSVVLAALSFVIFSILIPTHLVIRVAFTTTNKLYDETRTLLSLGPLYNHYRHGSQLFASLFFATNIAFGITVGAGQKSGTAQAIIILVVEVISALVTSIWLPWGSGASMGLISFLFCVARIVVAVLLVILTPAISVGPGPGGWVTYGILIILALVYLALLLMLLMKITEGVVRIVGGVGFDRSRHTVDSGLLGVFGLLGCCGTRKRNSRRRRSNKHKSSNLAPSQTQTRDSDLSSYMPPIGGIQPLSVNGTVTPPRFLNNDSRKGSAHSQPPSVLKPEQANKPYKEELLDSEDEGYIMGAWQPFPRQGYSALGDGHSGQQKPKGSAPAPPTSGFSRVGGGRAHIDTPYAIATGSTHTFPSIGQQSHSQQQNVNHSSSALVASPLFFEHTNDSEDVPVALSNVEMGMNGLPSGAMQPAHIRTKSQTAIVEDFSPSGPSSSSMSKQFQQNQAQSSTPNYHRQTHVSQDTYLRPPEAMAASKFTLGGGADDEDSADEQDNQRKKRPWYHIRRSRPHSVEGRTSTAASTSDLGKGVDEELGGLGNGGNNTAPQPQRSFVVIRKPAASMGRLNQASSSSANDDANRARASATYPSASERPPTR
ncbi:hypothetical protein CPB84DRAFT_1759012 [Gymnopilus junonius]|uniref:TRP C-terminal domain-containing protein n=1 Tax=Gymnopilus junonius TaxID=109634 RepID=A0A9P5TU63_GYMJU|nr:hypothetical protein CPB84DRAFT_1759012 [Gymnopilus junonius]